MNITSSSATRRDFICRSGLLLSAAALQACAQGAGVLRPDEARRSALDADRRDPPPAGPPVLQALALGLLSPSAHNTQPWRFRLLDDQTALLYVDRSRLLPQTDPPARQIHLSCGCFVEAFVIGASSLGWSSDVALFPEGPYQGEESFGRLPVARLSLTSRSGSTDSLAPFMYPRQTSRLVYTGKLLAAADFNPVLRDAGLRQLKATVVTGTDLPDYLQICIAAMETETRHRPTNEETRHWFRFSNDEAASQRDGLTFEANGLRGASATMAKWFTKDTAESWNGKKSLEKGLDNFRKVAESGRGLLLLSTATNTHVDHLEGGRDTYRLWLSLTKHGLYAHPMNQVIQEYEAMRALRQRFEQRCGIAEPSKVQMILRVGQSEVPWMSYRRRLSAFVDGKTLGSEG